MMKQSKGNAMKSRTEAGLQAEAPCHITTGMHAALPGIALALMRTAEAGPTSEIRADAARLAERALNADVVAIGMAAEIAICATVPGVRAAAWAAVGRSLAAVEDALAELKATPEQTAS